MAPTFVILSSIFDVHVNTVHVFLNYDELEEDEENAVEEALVEAEFMENVIAATENT